MTAMFVGDMDETQMKNLVKLGGPDYAEGSVVKVLFSSEEMQLSLTYAWFKAGYPLPRHSHSADCLYYVVSGEMRMGDDKMGAGDAIFVPAGSLYTFETGPEGLEFVEFRKAARYDIKFNAPAKAWDRQVAQRDANVEAWRKAKPPTAVRRMMGEA
jgi:mannose-6-phosphate isomerase-like protein (cupin superfamily)